MKKLVLSMALFLALGSALLVVSAQDNNTQDETKKERSEERRVGKEC